MLDISALPPQEGNAQSADSDAQPQIELQTSEVALALIDALACWGMPIKDAAMQLTQFGQKHNLDNPSSLLSKSLQLSKNSHAEAKIALAVSHTGLQRPTTTQIPSPFACFHQHVSTSQRVTPTPAHVAHVPHMQTSHLAKQHVHHVTSELKSQTKSAESSVVQSSQTAASQNYIRTRHASEAIPPLFIRLEKKTISVSLQQPSHWQRQDQEESNSQHRQWKSQEEDACTHQSVKKVASVAATRLVAPPLPRNKTQEAMAAILKQPAELLSEALKMRVSYFDVLILFFELMKLEIDSQEDEKLARRAERQAQLKYLDKEVANFKSQAKWMLFSHVGAGVLGIASGVAPILGHMKGDGILGTLSTVFSSLKGAKKKDFFDGISKMTYAMSEMQKATGQIYGTSAEGDRTRFNRFSDLHRTDQEELTRSTEQLQERLRQSERFLIDLLQMRHDATSQLYR